MTKHLLDLNVLTLVLTLGIFFLFRFVLLSIALWMMLKIQDLNYHIPGLLGSAAAASLCDMIPFVGHYLAVAVLFLCVMKLTQSEIIDIRFTVTVSYAVMFLMQMLLISAVPGNLHVSARMPASGQTEQKTAAEDDDADEPATNAVTMLTNRPPASHATNTLSQPAVVVHAPQFPVPARPDVTNAASPALPAVAPAKPSIETVKKFKLKGVVRNGGNSMVMVDTGAKTYTLEIGETQAVTTADGEVEFTLVQLTGNGAIFRSGGQTTLLRLP